MRKKGRKNKTGVNWSNLDEKKKYKREYTQKWRRENQEQHRIYCRKYYEEHKEERRNYYRRTHLSSGNNKCFSGLNKRPYPEDNCCEVCDKFFPKNLKYHHWDDNNPSIGIWVCGQCHNFVELVDKNLVEKYLKLKNEILNRKDN